MKKLGISVRRQHSQGCTLLSGWSWDVKLLSVRSRSQTLFIHLSYLGWAVFKTFRIDFISIQVGISLFLLCLSPILKAGRKLEYLQGVKIKHMLSSPR